MRKILLLLCLPANLTVSEYTAITVLYFLCVQCSARVPERCSEFSLLVECSAVAVSVSPLPSNRDSYRPCSAPTDGLDMLQQYSVLYSALHSAVLYVTALHCTVLNCVALHCNATHCSVVYEKTDVEGLLYKR